MDPSFGDELEMTDNPLRHSLAWRISLVVCILEAGLVVSALPASAQTEPGASGAVAEEPIVRYSRDPQAVVASLTEVVAEIDDPDRGPSVTVYGDGRVLIHYPHYMKRAGDWELRLSDAELDALLVSLGGKLAAFDTQDALSELSQARLRGTSGAPDGDPADVDVSDPGATKIRLRLVSYRYATGGDSELRNVDKQIEWMGLRGDAERHTRVVSVQELAAAHRELLALMERTDLEKLP
jgi:hypothetical protein